MPCVIWTQEFSTGVFAAMTTSTHELHYVMFENKTIFVGNFPLQELDGVVLKFDDFIALSAD